MENKLTTVHDAVNDAKFAPSPVENDPKTTVFAVRMPKHLKEQAEFFCERNSTTLAEFLRQCCTGLVNDYVNPAIK